MLILSLFLACMQEPEVLVETEYITETETEYITETEYVTEETCASVLGRIPCDFTLIDENGDEVSFLSLVGKPMILDLSAMWCSPCKAAGREVQEVQDKYPEITYLTILIENLQAEPPSAIDLQTWEYDLGIGSAPTWGGSRDVITSNPIETAGEFYLGGWPTFYFLDAELRIVGYQRGYEASVIEGWAETLAE